jgi:hypothetical protein
MKLRTPLSTLAAVLLATLPVVGADSLAPLDVRDVKVGDEIGRRVAITVTNNLLKLDVDGDFLRPFTAVPRTGESIGLGMMLDSTITFAAHRSIPRSAACVQVTFHYSATSCCSCRWSRCTPHDA